MSDSFAIAAVTATIAYLLEKQGGVTVTTKAPDASNITTTRLNIFLYQVTPNVGYLNMDSPARNYSGQLMRKQKLALDLHYLMTAYGNNDEELSAQKTLAEVMRVLHENPVLTPDLIEEALISSEFPDIESSSLPRQVEMIKVTMHSLSLEDLTKIWSSFFKTGSYRISVAYKATVVLLDGKHEPMSTMPVKRLNSYVHTTRRPWVTHIEPQIVPWASGGVKIKILGRNLRSSIIKIDFGQGLEVENMAEPTSVSANELSIEIPDTVGPGVKQVRVLQPILIGTPEKLHNGLESNMALFAVVPVIEDIDPVTLTRGSKLTIKFKPAISSEQDVNVIISTYEPLKVERIITSDSTTDTVQVTIPADYETNKDFPVRLIINGVESQPDEEKWKNEFMRPVVRIIG